MHKNGKKIIKKTHCSLTLNVSNVAGVRLANLKMMDHRLPVALKDELGLGVRSLHTVCRLHFSTFLASEHECRGYLPVWQM